MTFRQDAKPWLFPVSTAAGRVLEAGGAVKRMRDNRRSVYVFNLWLQHTVLRTSLDADNPELRWRSHMLLAIMEETFRALEGG